MKRFLIRILFLGIVLTILGIGFELSLRSIPNSLVFKDELMARKASEVKTLIIGSSVAAHGIFPAYLGDSAYNLAIPSERIKYNEASLMRFIDKMPQLRTILWGITDHILYTTDINHFIVYQHLYRGFELDSHNPLYEIECIQNFTLAMEKWRKHYLLRQPTVRCDSLGFDYSCASSGAPFRWEKKWEKQLKSESVDVHQERNKQIYHQNLESMLRVARACKERSIRLCLVVTPSHSLHYTRAGEKQLNLMYDALQEICKQYDNVQYFDYFKDNRFTDDDFHDLKHLSEAGAKKFTLILKKEILE